MDYFDGALVAAWCLMVGLLLATADSLVSLSTNIDAPCVLYFLGSALGFVSTVNWEMKISALRKSISQGLVSETEDYSIYFVGIDFWTVTLYPLAMFFYIVGAAILFAQGSNSNFLYFTANLVFLIAALVWMKVVYKTGYDIQQHSMADISQYYEDVLPVSAAFLVGSILFLIDSVCTMQSSVDVHSQLYLASSAVYVVGCFEWFVTTYFVIEDKTKTVRRARGEGSTLLNTGT